MLCENGGDYVQVVFSIMLLLSGSAIYCLFRPDVVFLLPLVDVLAPVAVISDGCVLKSVAYNLPDALWFASLLNLQPNPFILRYRTFYVALVLPFIHEFGQFVGLFPGTFDTLDLITYLLVLSIFIIIWKNKRSQKVCSA